MLKPYLNWAIHTISQENTKSHFSVQKVLTYNPDNESCYFNLGIAYRANEKRNEAYDAYKKRLKLTRITLKPGMLSVLFAGNEEITMKPPMHIKKP